MNMKIRSLGDCRHTYKADCWCKCRHLGCHGDTDASARVALHVFGEVVGPHELGAAHGAHELLLSGVGSLVARQLVRSCEASPAAFPRTVVGLLPCMRSVVRLQM